ncbi:hypothetical protein K7B10_35955 [Streptomyces flavotricini]|uniref:Uncharacterized protein n=1 Tax=Streptomyces flavotricini TaxID=66888 RepID=A0ABS8EGM2_9ACTN|nr:hypothetical protein [Streptomyces flavotricini]MCC0100088.1 hypothetical protein [Streptomyces flavotricini]
MAEEWTHEPRPVRDRPDADGLTADARTLLARHGPGARFWTNAVAAAADPAPTPSRRPARTLGPLVPHRRVRQRLDLFGGPGLIAVLGDEVGVFWSIGAY